MRVDISRQAMLNFFQEFKKKEIDPKERASLLKQFREQNGMSQRALAKIIGISHSIIQDWELWNRITTEQVRHAISKGYTRTDIYRSLRNNSGLEKFKKDNYVIDCILRDAVKDLKYYIEHRNYSRETEVLIKELQNTLNRILMRIDK